MAEPRLDDDLLAPASLVDPFPQLAVLRERDPVRWSERYRAWLLTRYDDCAAAHTDPHFSSDRMTPLLRRAEEHGAPDALLAALRVLAGWMTFKDGPPHRRLRGLVLRAFTPRTVARMREGIAAVADELLDDLDDDARGEADLVAQLAYPLPAIVIAEMLGVPPADRDRFKAWSRDVAALVFGAVDDPDRYERAQAGMGELIAYFEELIDQAREREDDVLLCHLVRAQTPEGDALTRTELLAMCTLLLFGGHETTTNLLSSGLLALLRHPDQLALLAGDDALAQSAVEEFLRYDGPTRLSVRVMAEPLELRDRSLRAGDRVFLVLAAANRDPERFERPDELDITRDPNAQIGFGLGPHYCLGAPLARLEAQLTIPRAIRRLRELELAVDAAQLRWQPTLLSRSLRSLPVRFSGVTSAS
ncbi:cytochrome P450 [Capillimicrobium parvum]|uniref:Cytochrome P450 monooxygenase PikC n=1 Tax=Capillimicrobium parvum TaxID=2884022 RepID=A0A9E6XUP9_9ACTN|nr:cytochrome P450 [Capillimicrobium parvum]UGS34751.1 Cytochrome P450 monooxygenase PikC [Capillimicrobium parvum]